MRRFHWLGIYCLILMILLFTGSALVASSGAMAAYKTSARQNSVIHGVRNINAASQSIMDAITRIAREGAKEKYDRLREVADDDDSYPLRESELEMYFRLGYYNSIREALEDEDGNVYDRIDDIISEAGVENVSCKREGSCTVAKEVNDKGDICGITIRNLTLLYTDPIIGTRTETVSYRIGIPKVIFYTGNDDLAAYSMVALKGIYATGATSSVVGSIYAGGHKEEEKRASDLEYGEIGYYGGLNILSTQMGIASDTIICDGDININGSFVIFEGNDESLSCYARQINSINGYKKESMYSIDGDFYSTTGTYDEDKLGKFFSDKNMMSVAGSKLSAINIYYDSNNDEKYEGPYRKIISNSDVELSEDITGMVMTPCNVIVDQGVNVEGIIICGDRIYLRGDNSIVSDISVIRRILEYEEDSKDEVMVKDYIGGIMKKQIRDPKYYVVPYR